MRTNSGAGEAKNNNHDHSLRDHEGSKGPAQRSGQLDRQEEQAGAAAPADHRGGRK